MKPVCKKCYEKFPLELKKRLKKLAETLGRKWRLHLPSPSSGKISDLLPGGAALRLPSDERWRCMPSVKSKYLKILSSLYMYAYAYLLINRPHFQSKPNTSSPERFLTLTMPLNWCKWPVLRSNLCGVSQRQQICLWIPVKTNGAHVSNFRGMHCHLY